MVSLDSRHGQTDRVSGREGGEREGEGEGESERERERERA